MMNREIPMIPHLYMPTCDVRDVSLNRSFKLKFFNIIYLVFL